MVGVGIGAGVGAGAGQGMAGAGFQGGAETVNAPVGQQKRQPGLIAGGAGTVVAEQQRNVAAHIGGLVGRREQVQRNAGRVAAGAHLAAYRHIEPGHGGAVHFLNSRREGDILRSGVGAVLPAAGNGYIELAGQVGVLPVADEHCGELLGNGGGVQQLVGRQAGRRAAHHGADVVHTGLQRNQPDGRQPVPDVRHLLNGEFPQLHLLPGGQVGKPHPVVGADGGQGAELVGVADAVGDADAHHKTARRLPAKEHAGPLQPVAVVRWNGFPTVAAEGGEVIEDVQAVFCGLDDFNFVHCCCLPVADAAVRRPFSRFIG